MTGMKRNIGIPAGFFTTLVALGVGYAVLEKRAAVQAAGIQAPVFEVDPLWPKPLPNHWIGGNGQKDSEVLKFTQDGKFLLQIGHFGQSKGSNDTENLHQAAKIFVDQAANEAYVADGYGNKRVIVYDADTGRYKRHWGAY